MVPRGTKTVKGAIAVLAVLLLTGCAASPGSPPSPSMPTATPAPAIPPESELASSTTATPAPSDARQPPDPRLADLTWVALDPETSAWILGIGPDASWRPELGDRGHATANFGRFAVVIAGGDTPTVGIGHPATRTLTQIASPFDGPPFDAVVDPSGEWLFLHAGANGVDEGVVALNPRTAEQRVLAPRSKLKNSNDVRNHLLWSPTGDTLVSTLCDLRRFLVDVIDVRAMTATRLHSPFAAVAATDRYLVGSGPEGSLWQVLDLTAGEITPLGLDRAAFVTGLVPIDDTHVALNVKLGGTSSIVVADLASGEQRVLHTETLTGDEAEPELALMRHEVIDGRYLLVSASRSFSDLLSEHPEPPAIHLLDIESGTLVGTQLTIAP